MRITQDKFPRKRRRTCSRPGRCLQNRRIARSAPRPESGSGRSAERCVVHSLEVVLAPPFLSLLVAERPHDAAHANAGNEAAATGALDRRQDAPSSCRCRLGKLDPAERNSLSRRRKRPKRLARAWLFVGRRGEIGRIL